VTAGGIDRTTTETGEISLTSRTAIYHEQYKENTLSNDIAVIKLPQNLPLSNIFIVLQIELFLGEIFYR
jgi:secreted trypsin-like serine protease